MPTIFAHFSLPFCQQVLLCLLCTAISSVGAHPATNADELSATFALQTRPFLVEPNDEKHGDVLVREGDPGPVLNCSVAEQFRDRSRYELEWTKVVGDMPNLVSRNGRLFVAASGPDGYELTDSVPQDGGYNLRLKQVQLQRDNGRFFCALIDTETRQQTLSEPARVVVLVPPEPPQITVQPVEAVREGDFITLRCESSGGNPAPRFQWLFENKTRVPEGWFHEKATEPGKSVSSLQMHVKSVHNGAHLVCKVWNGALEEGKFLQVESNKLNVLYAPQVRLVPPTPELNVEEGEQVPLLCVADANPPALNFQWTHVPSGEVFNGKEWHLTVRKVHAGEIRCTATNSLDSGSARLRLNVLYGPHVRVKTAAGGEGSTTVSPAEGDRLVLDCETEANPKVDAVAWSGPGGIRQNGSRLVIDSVNRAHTGNFTCTAWNTLALTSAHTADHSPQPVIRTGVAQLRVDVRRKPGAALIVAKRTAVNVGEPIQLGCSADGDVGSPPAKFKWAGPASKGMYNAKEADWNRAQLRLAEARLADNGLYRCVAYNEIGQGEETSIRILVVEPARIIRPLLPGRTLSANTMDVQMECEARGYPQPTIRWLRDGLPLPVESSKLWTAEQRVSASGCAPEEPACPATVHSTLHLSHLTSWADKGNYSCVASNTPLSSTAAASPASSSTQLSFIHEPIILNRRFADDDSVGLAAADLGAMAQISCLVSARPEPRVSWSRDGLAIGAGIGGGFEEERRYKVRMSRVAGAVDEFESVLELDQVADRDFGTFVCEARNGAGGMKSTVDIRLHPKSRPQTPVQAKMLRSGLNWLLVGWQPGFDGGLQQTFTLEYRLVDPYSGRADVDQEPVQFTFGPANWSSMAIFENDDSVRPEHFLVHNLTQLRPQSSVWYRLRARNALGTSDWTPLTGAGTEDARESADIQAPESLLYLPDERRLVAQPLRRSASHCLLVYAASAEDGQWRSIDCFPLADSDGSIEDIEPAERFKARYCLASDLGKCSTAIKIFVENFASSTAHTLWMLAFIVAVVCVLSCTVLLALFCFRRRFQKANGRLSAATRNATNGGVAKPRKKLNLNGGTGTILVDRMETPPLAHQQSGTSKNTPVNGSQTDSGVFTLGSSSAMAATAVAINGMNGNNGMHKGAGAAAALAGMCGEQANGGNPAWDHHQHQQQPSPQHLSPHQLMEPYDFSNDPFLQEFAAANALGGIVVVENSLHQNSSAESTPSILQPQSSYSKFFNDFSAAFLGNATKAAGANNNRHSTIGGGGRPMTTSMLLEGGGAGTASMAEPQKSNSNEQLLMAGSGSGGEASSDTSSTLGNGNGGSGGGGGRTTAAGRVMREIIV